MFTVIRKSYYLYLDSTKNAALDSKEWSVASVCSYKIRLVRKAVVQDVGLPE